MQKGNYAHQSTACRFRMNLPGCSSGSHRKRGARHAGSAGEGAYASAHTPVARGRSGRCSRTRRGDGEDGERQAASGRHSRLLRAWRRGPGGCGQGPRASRTSAAPARPPLEDADEPPPRHAAPRRRSRLATLHAAAAARSCRSPDPHGRRFNLESRCGGLGRGRGGN